MILTLHYEGKCSSITLRWLKLLHHFYQLYHSLLFCQFHLLLLSKHDLLLEPWSCSPNLVTCISLKKLVLKQAPFPYHFSSESSHVKGYLHREFQCFFGIRIYPLYVEKLVEFVLLSILIKILHWHATINIILPMCSDFLFLLESSEELELLNLYP